MLENLTRVVEYIEARGHSHIRATHRTTFEITKDSNLTKNGNCIVAVSASKGLQDLSEEFAVYCRNDNSVITVRMELDGMVEKAVGRGNRLLRLSHPSNLVVRRSRFVCERTLMIESNKSASDLKRSFVSHLQRSRQKIEILLTAEPAKV